MFVVKGNLVVGGDFPATTWQTNFPVHDAGTLLTGEETSRPQKDGMGARWPVRSYKTNASSRDPLTNHNSLSSLTKPPANFWFHYFERGEQRE